MQRLGDAAGRVWRRSPTWRTAATSRCTWTARRIFNAAIALGVAAKEIAQSRRLGDVLRLEGAGRAGRLGDLRHPGVHRAGVSRPEDHRRRDAAGRRHRGRRPLRPEAQHRRGWPRTMPTPAGWPTACGACRRLDRPRRRPDQHVLHPAERVRSQRAELSARLREQGILCGAAKDGSPVMRLVTHYGIERADIDRAIDAFARGPRRPAGRRRSGGHGVGDRGQGSRSAGDSTTLLPTASTEEVPMAVRLVVADDYNDVYGNSPVVRRACVSAAT